MILITRTTITAIAPPQTPSAVTIANNGQGCHTYDRFSAVTVVTAATAVTSVTVVRPVMAVTAVAWYGTLPKCIAVLTLYDLGSVCDKK